MPPTRLVLTWVNPARADDPAAISRVRSPTPFVAMMPQWEFLDFLRVEAKGLAGFALRMEAPVLAGWQHSIREFFPAPGARRR